VDDPDLKLLIGIVLLVVIGAAGWHYRDTLLPPAVEPVISAPPEEADTTESGPQEPLHPIEPGANTERDLVPLPPLDDSDSYFLLEVGQVFGTGIESLLLRDAIIDRLVTTIDNLPRDHVSEKIRPVNSLSRSFEANPTSDDTVYLLGAENHSRYDELMSRIAAADTNSAVDIYRRFYPLFQKSYERLGYPGAYFNDRVIEVIDHLLDTPVLDGPIELVRPNVLYEFRDPELEALSSGQKLVLRMGAEHAATLKTLLAELRTKLASP
jgi:hypothetical protein